MTQCATRRHVHLDTLMYLLDHSHTPHMTADAPRRSGGTCARPKVRAPTVPAGALTRSLQPARVVSPVLASQRQPRAGAAPRRRCRRRPGSALVRLGARPRHLGGTRDRLMSICGAGTAADPRPTGPAGCRAPLVAVAARVMGIEGLKVPPGRPLQPLGRRCREASPRDAHETVIGRHPAGGNPGAGGHGEGLSRHRRRDGHHGRGRRPVTPRAGTRPVRDGDQQDW